MSNKFPKINIKFHSNVITYNQTVGSQIVVETQKE